MDWNHESARGSDYAKIGYLIHITFTSVAAIGSAFYVGSSATLSGTQKASLGLLILFLGVALTAFGRIVLELFRTVFKVERQLNVLQDLSRQNRIRPNLELIESQLREISARNTEVVLHPLLLQIERHLATPKELAPQENLLPALERINEQLEATRLDYSRATLDSTLRNIEQNIDNLSKKTSNKEVIANIDELKMQLLHESSQAPDSSLQQILEAIEKFLKEISQQNFLKKPVKRLAKRKSVDKRPASTVKNSKKRKLAP
jgi:hypothetical protein